MANFDEEILMTTLDKWDDRDRRQRFIRRMEHKLHNKEQHLSHDRY